MLIRQLFVAAVAAGAACAAQADVIPATGSTTTPAVLSGWTGANGTDVLSSGVLSGNLSLIGGLSYSEASKVSGAAGSATLADVLMGKASASVGQTTDGQTQLFYKQGIEGMYLLGAGHGILAAMLGNGVSVVGSSGGVIVSQGQGGSGAAVGGSVSVGGAGGGGGGGGGSGGGSAGGAGGSGGSGGGSSGGSGSGSSGSGGTVVPVPSAIDPIPTAGSGGTGGTGGNGGIGGNSGGVVGTPGSDLPGATPSGEVPEPSSIALMMAGLLGAGSLVRRRRG
jgi:hypothetical protein